MLASRLKRFGLLLVAVLAGLAAYLLLWPVPVEPVAWRAPVAPGYVGPHAANTRLSNLHTISIGKEGVWKEDGRVDPSGAYPETTAITETRDRLYVQSLHAKVLGWLPRKGE